jgi:dienelactone hydrolase
VRRRALTATLTFGSFILLGACSGTEDGLPQSSGGTGGAQSSGGTAGALSTGGSSAGSAGSGGVSASGGTMATGGSTGGTDSAGTGGTNVAGTSGGGGAGAGGAGSGGGGAAGTSNAGSGGDAGAGGTSGTAGSGGDGGGTAGASSGGSGGGGGSGTCTPSSRSGGKASGSGPHDVVIETNSDDGIDEGTIFRPAELGGAETYPILVWGQGACSRNGLANEAAMVEIASHGYFVVADGTPNGTGNRVMDRSQLEAMAAPLIAYIDWAIVENAKPCSAYYQSLATTKLAANGFSCGGLMAQAMITDPRVVTWGVTSSGMAGADQAFYDAIDTPVLFVEGGPGDVAYEGAAEGYDAISQLGVPVLWFSADRGHGGDLLQPDGGDFTAINLAWLNWWLKDDVSATGKGRLVGAGCPYCDDAAWEYRSANIP